MQLVFSLGGLIVWFIGGRDVLGGDMTLGALMAFLAYLAIFYTPLSTLAQLTTWLTSFMTASHRVTIRRAPVCFGLVKVAGRSYYQTLRDKLHWGTPPNYRTEPPDRL